MRTSNPTRTALENCLAESGSFALAFASRRSAAVLSCAC
jgi:O-acetylhomoserine/O-acetylserine sulfhydrylase-like pyridoxal-dependent enzyme